MKTVMKLRLLSNTETRDQASETAQHVLARQQLQGVPGCEKGASRGCLGWHGWLAPSGLPTLSLSCNLSARIPADGQSSVKRSQTTPYFTSVVMWHLWLCGTRRGEVFDMQLLEPEELPISETQICSGQKKYSWRRTVAGLILDKVVNQCGTNLCFIYNHLDVCMNLLSLASHLREHSSLEHSSPTEVCEKSLQACQLNVHIILSVFNQKSDAKVAQPTVRNAFHH